jgi:hypothetical protein
MNALSTLGPWSAALGWLALEAAVVVLAALAVQPLVRAAAARRSLWRAVLVALGLLLAAEFTGATSQLPAQLRLAWQTTFPAPASPPAPPRPLTESPSTPPPSSPLAPRGVVGGGVGAVPAPDALQLEPVPPLPPSPRSLSHPPTFSPAPPVWPAFLWLAGLAALLARSAWTHAGFAWLRLRHFIPAAEALRQRVQSLAARLGLRRRVRVLASERLRAPAAFGWLRPGVGVPGDFTARFAPAQQDVMLAHELAHLAARDPLWQLLADLVTAALWWHPLAWVARRQHRLAGELAADDASLALPDGPVVLAECLLTLGHEAADCPRAALGMAGFRSQLGRRVERLLALPRRDWQAPSRARLALQTAVALLALAALALLPGCAANRAENEPPSRLVAKWWQAKSQTPETQPRGATLLIQPKPKPVIVQGRVSFNGTPPPERDIPLPPPVLTARSNAPVMTRFHRVSPDGGLADVLVYVKDGLAGQTFDPPTNTFVVRADQYEFEPYIGAIQAGQTVRWESRLATGLSIHPTPTNRENREFNFTLMANKSLDARFTGPELFLRVKVDVFPWMMHYVSVFEHPFFAVTDAEGRFHFPQPLPPGKYTLAAVHRQAGTETRELVVDASFDAAKPIALTLGAVTGREAILRKLAETRLPEVTYDGLPLPEVVKFLSLDTKRYDPAKRGVHFALHTAKTNSPAAVDLETVLIKVSTVLRDVSVLEALDAILKTADAHRPTDGQSAALEYLIETDRVVFRERTKPAAAAEPAAATMTPRQREIRQRLEAVVLPSVQYHGLPLPEVIKMLAQDARRHDSEKRGFNLLLSSTGQPGPTEQQVDLDVVLIQHPEVRKNVTVREVLDAICQTAEVKRPDGVAAGLKYSVEGFGILFTPDHSRTANAKPAAPPVLVPPHAPLPAATPPTPAPPGTSRPINAALAREHCDRLEALVKILRASAATTAQDYANVVGLIEQALTEYAAVLPPAAPELTRLKRLLEEAKSLAPKLKAEAALPAPVAADVRRLTPSETPDAKPPTPTASQSLLTSAATNVLDISVGRQLFVDDFLIASSSLQRIWHKPAFFTDMPLVKLPAALTPLGPLPVCDRIWYDTTNQLFKMRFATSNGVVAVFHSASGTNWVRGETNATDPVLRLHLAGSMVGAATFYETVSLNLFNSALYTNVPPGVSFTGSVAPGLWSHFGRSGSLRRLVGDGLFISPPTIPVGAKWENMYPALDAFLVVGRNLYFYFGGQMTLPGEQQAQPAVGLATLRRDGFASLDAGPEGGVLTTKPVTFTGRFLFVNFKTNAPDGEMRIEILDADGNALERYSRAKSIALAADQTLMGVSWQNGAQDLSALIGKPVRFRFHLKNASLYSFWVGPGQLGRSMGRVAGGGPHFTNDVDTIGNRSYQPFPRTTNAAALPPKPGALAAGDYLSVEVAFGPDSTNQPLRVRGQIASSGHFAMPRANQVVVVAGKTTNEAKQSIRAAYLASGMENPVVTVTKVQPPPKSQAAPATAIPSAGIHHQPTVEKLGRIRIPELTYDGLSLSEVLKFLEADTRKNDPARQGVSFEMRSIHTYTTFIGYDSVPPEFAGEIQAQSAGSGTVGVSLTATVPLPRSQVRQVGINNIGTVPIHVTSVLREVSVLDALDAIVKTAEASIDYTIETNRVVLHPRQPGKPPKPVSARGMHEWLRLQLQQVYHIEQKLKNPALSVSERLSLLSSFNNVVTYAGSFVETAPATNSPGARPANGTVIIPPSFQRASQGAWEDLERQKLSLDRTIKEQSLIYRPDHDKMKTLHRQRDALEKALKVELGNSQSRFEIIKLNLLKREKQLSDSVDDTAPKTPSPPKPGASLQPAPAPAAADVRRFTSPQTPDAISQTPPTSQSLVTSAATPVQLAAASPKGVTLPVPNPYHRTNSQVPFLTHSSKGAQRINRKLEEIVLPEVHFDAVPLVGVVQRLIEDAKKFDPEKLGLNFLINDVAPAAPLLDAAGNPVPVARPVALSEGLVRVSQPLKNLTLRQALDVICKNAELPTQFSVEEYAIAFIPRGPVAYYSRMFRVNPDTFIQGLQGVVGHPVLGVTVGGNQPGAAGQNQPASTTTTTGPVRATVPATVPATQRTAAEANSLVRQFFLSAGVTSLGVTNSSTRVFFNPENGLLIARGTTNDLRVIEQVIQKVPPPSLTTTNPVPSNLPKPNPNYRTNAPVQPAPHSSKGAQRNNAKLDEIILPEIHFDGVSLPAVVTWLDGNVKKHDPEKKGLNFLINNVASRYISLNDAKVGKPAAPLLDPMGNPIASPAVKPARPDLENALIKVPKPIKNLTLRQVLDVICKTATVKMPDGRAAGLKFTIEEYAIVFSPKLPERASLFPRMFKVDPETFITGLGSVVDEREFRPGSRATLDQALRAKAWTNAPAGTNRFSVVGIPVTNGLIGVASTNVTAELNHLVRAYFTAAGVANLGVTNGPDATQVFFNDRNGLLLVRASLQDLDIIQQAIELLNAKPAIKSPETK